MLGWLSGTEKPSRALLSTLLQRIYKANVSNMFLFWPLSPSYSENIRHRNRAPAPCQRRWGMSMCPGGPHGPLRGGRPTSGTASGSAEADESVCVEQRNSYNHLCCGRNWRVSLESEFLHDTPQNVMKRDRRNTPYFTSMSACHESNRLKHLRLLQRT